MNEIMDMAKRLGELIGKSDEYMTVNVAEDALNDHPAFGPLMDEYQKARSAMQSASEKEEDVSAAALEVARLEEEIEALPLMRAYKEARARFQELMQSVNASLEEGMTGHPAHSCSGHCSGCGGCTHD